MERDTPLRGVGKTALGMAMIRAGESGRADRLFDDPYAQAFLEAAPAAFAADEARAVRDRSSASLGAAFASHAVLRTRFFDDFLLTAVGAGCRQVILLAAGLDSR
ncbi:MAG: class I SAM-dependent methyltransferase, partial [Streptosporangiales bacterium]|nr:class I SAM-dependent methyltransferase [Streptosporangiales bacterium]